MTQRKFIFSSYISIVLVLTFITFITYINILPNQLFYDDEELIYKNAYVADLKNFPKYFTENMIAGAGKISNMYRPILLVSFALDHLVWNNNPIGYHLTSILLHAGNSILIFLLIYSLFKDRLLALITSILFIIHPVQTEAIAYTSGRTDPLFSLFALASLLFSLSFLNTHQYQLLKYIAAILFFILAILSKETALVLPLLLLLVALIKLRKGKNTTRKLLAILIPFFFLDLIYIFLRLTLLNFADTLNFYQTANIYSQNLLVRLLTFTKVFFEYLLILLFPKELMFAREVKFITSLLNPWVILFILLVITLFIASIKYFHKNRLFLFSFFWFFIIILPVSGILPINNIIAEHYLYLPSIAFFLLFSYLSAFLWRKYSDLKQRTLFIIFSALIFATFFVRTIIRAFDWRDPIAFYTKSLAQSPWHVPMRHNLAMAYAEKGQLERAIREYKTSISLADIYPQTHHNLANAYKAIGKYKEAEEEYKKALVMDPNFTFSYYELADLYQKTGEKEKLKEVMEKLKM